MRGREPPRFQRAAVERLQVDQQVLGGLIPSIPILLNALADDAVQLQRDIVIESRDGVGLDIENPRQRLLGVRADEWQPPGSRFIEDHPQTEKIRPGIDGLAQRLFRAHILDGPHHYARHGHQLRLFRLRVHHRIQLRDSKVQDFQAHRRHDQVGGLDVAMDDALRVGGHQYARRLPTQANQLGNREGSARDPGVEGFAIRELHGDEPQVAVLGQFVDGRDMGVVQRASEPGFLHEALAAFGVGGEIRWKNLERDVAAQQFVVRQIHFAHAALAQLADDSIARDVGEGFSSHFIHKEYSVQLENACLSFPFPA